MKTVLPILLAALGLAGCATPFPSPDDVAQIKLDRANSSVVRIEKLWLERNNGILVLRGHVQRQPGAGHTGQTHLDVTLYDGAGRVLRSTVEYFAPRQIPARQRRHDAASYEAKLDPLPTGTARIEVRAHEESHG